MFVTALTRFRACSLAAAASCVMTLWAAPALALAGAQPAPLTSPSPHAAGSLGELSLDPRPSGEEGDYWALACLPVAAALGSVLAFRPQRRGTPRRNPAVIQTQIILSLVGALVMLVVGASLARAFGIVGAASLVRYRAKIDDPKDAGVMLSCLAIGLASGVGIYKIATFSTLFILGVLWALESLEPESRKDFMLKVKLKDSAKVQPRIEEVLRRNNIKYELRSSSLDDLTYSVKLPLTKRTDRLTSALAALAPTGEDMAVEWSDKKPKNDGA